MLLVGGLIVVASGMSGDARAPGPAPACPLMAEQDLREQAEVVVVAVAEPGPSDDAGHLVSPATFRTVEEVKGNVGDEFVVETPVRPEGGPLPQEDAFLPGAGETWRLYLSEGSDPTAYVTNGCSGSRQQGANRPSVGPTDPSPSPTPSTSPSASAMANERPNESSRSLEQTSEGFSGTSARSRRNATTQALILGGGAVTVCLLLLVGAYLQRRSATSQERGSRASQGDQTTSL